MIPESDVAREMVEAIPSGRSLRALYTLLLKGAAAYPGDPTTVTSQHGQEVATELHRILTEQFPSLAAERRGDPVRQALVQSAADADAASTTFLHTLENAINDERALQNERVYRTPEHRRRGFGQMRSCAEHFLTPCADMLRCSEYDGTRVKDPISLDDIKPETCLAFASSSHVKHCIDAESLAKTWASLGVTQNPITRETGHEASAFCDRDTDRPRNAYYDQRSLNKNALPRVSNYDDGGPVALRQVVPPPGRIITAPQAM